MDFFIHKPRIAKVTLLMFFTCAVFAFTARAQSTDQNFPTPVTSNQIDGAIPARDIGDARRTTYFYTFNGTQGDVFLNVVTKNFDGAIDVFNAEGLQPIAKIVFYAGDSSQETGRVFYLRKPERLILRVQGRTPNDDAATFQIKFAGSFAPSTIAETGRPELPKVTRENQGDVIVNSVGTIIAVKPTPTPEAEKEETIAEKPLEPEEREETEIAETKPETEPQITETEEEKPVKVIVTDPAAEAVNEKTEEKIEKKAESAPETIEETTEEKTETTGENEETEREKKQKALANIRLTVELKNGDKFVRPMSEIFSVNYDDGKMTIITKDGEIRRFSLLDIIKTTIE